MEWNIQRRDIAGQKFNRLTALTPDANRRGRTYWICQCDCGNKKSISTTCLLTRKTQSCGCALIEFLRGRATHGATCVDTSRNRRHSVEYTTWSALKNRCSSPSSPSYGGYGGRGIGMCDRWASSFENFLADMGPKPSPQHSIDRIDVNGNYEPGNCRWATWTEQARNRRSNRVIVAFGKSMLLAEWSESSGITRETIDQRIRHGWSPEKAVSTPTRRYGQSSTKTHAAMPAAVSAMATMAHGEDESTGAVPTVL